MTHCQLHKISHTVKVWQAKQEKVLVDLVRIHHKSKNNLVRQWWESLWAVQWLWCKPSVQVVWTPRRKLVLLLSLRCSNGLHKVMQLLEHCSILLGEFLGLYLNVTVEAQRSGQHTSRAHLPVEVY